MADVNLVHYAISAISGAFGAGVVWGTVLFRLRSQDARLERIESKQAKLRGECSPDGQPMYMPRAVCIAERAACHVVSERTAVELAKSAEENTTRIKMIENYIRYVMTKEGLSLNQITEILEHGRF